MVLLREWAIIIANTGTYDVMDSNPQMALGIA